MPPPPRPPSYPLDVTPSFTTAGRDAIHNVVPVGAAASGVLHDAEGDLRKYLLFNATRSARKELYTLTAYADLIDLNVVDLKDRAERIEARLTTLQQSIDALSGTLQQLVGLFGVVIPAWISKREVEEGDDMGLVRPSAEALELIVEYESVRQSPGFSHEDVVAIRPPAGTLVKRGSTVTVVLNLEG